MKKFFYLSALVLGLTFTTTACSNDETEEQAAPDLDYSAQNATAWGNYMRVVANLLNNDATQLYDDWNTSYKNGDSYTTIFKGAKAPFTSSLNCVEQVIDGCVDIANEVGTAKIGEPYDLYVSGQTAPALYAVESWYSWHSRDDYRNNIFSIRNAYYGTRNGAIHANSLSTAIAAVNATLDTKVKNAISAAAVAIYAIPDPFRNHINSTEASAAMDACAELETVLKNELKPYIQNNLTNETTLKTIIAQYVDAVVLPTYKDLKDKVGALKTAVEAFRTTPSDARFSACATAWLNAREPWETSEAFLFGPVADKGLDPNMDSWPLDQEGIVQILKSGNFEDLEWDGDYDEENTNIEAAQCLRGFHTLEYFIFKDGKPRTVSK